VAFHLFHITEVYSNADGTVQFVEFLGEANSQHLWKDEVLNATQGGITNSFTFPTNLPETSTSGRSVLVATQGYADLATALGLPAPDYIIPNGFLFTSGSVTVSVPGMDTVGPLALPRDGTVSINQNGVTAVSSPKNFAGQSGIVSAPALASPIPDQFAGNGQAFNLDSASAFTDADGSTLSFTANFTGVAWLNFDQSSGLFSGTPGLGDVGTFSVTVTASDGTVGSASDSFSITVISGQVITGTAESESLSGTANNDRISGLEGNDTLDGGAGDDTMLGGAGDDTYHVDSAGDSVVETSGQGTDLVFSSVTITLAANVENLTLTGGANLDGTGNALPNALTGNGGHNRLDGAGGTDTMTGGDGNDTYVVDAAGDSIIEGASGGTDTVESPLGWTLAANLENLALTGSANVNATGNAGGNVLTGNSGNNVLDGGAGADTMDGGDGNDVYIVDDPGDVATDSGTGTDRVESTASVTLGAGIENLTLLGPAALDGTGNALANLILGNGGANALEGDAGADTLLGGGGDDSLAGGEGNDRLEGGAGADTLAGGAGADTLDGGAGADVFFFDDLAAADRLHGFSSGEDEIWLSSAVFTALGAPGPVAPGSVQFALSGAITATSGDGGSDGQQDLLKFATDTGELYYDADGTGAGGLQLIVTLVSCGVSGLQLDLGAAQDILLV
jgi:Ca2+-binding RTX toxin-like protein